MPTTRFEIDAEAGKAVAIMTPHTEMIISDRGIQRRVLEVRYETNNEKFDEEWDVYLKHFGADAKTMRPAQPVRLPGARRDNGKVQSLLWISSRC